METTTYIPFLVEVADAKICADCPRFVMQSETLFDDGDHPRQHYACMNLDECSELLERFRECEKK